MFNDPTRSNPEEDHRPIQTGFGSVPTSPPQQTHLVTAALSELNKGSAQLLLELVSRETVVFTEIKALTQLFSGLLTLVDTYVLDASIKLKKALNELSDPKFSKFCISHCPHPHLSQAAYEAFSAYDQSASNKDAGHHLENAILFAERTPRFPIELIQKIIAIAGHRLLSLAVETNVLAHAVPYVFKLIRDTSYPIEERFALVSQIVVRCISANEEFVGTKLATAAIDLCRADPEQQTFLRNLLFLRCRAFTKCNEIEEALEDFRLGCELGGDKTCSHYSQARLNLYMHPDIPVEDQNELKPSTGEFNAPAEKFDSEGFDAALNSLDSSRQDKLSTGELLLLHTRMGIRTRGHED